MTLPLEPPSPTDVVLIAGGLYHDIDYVRLGLLEALGSIEAVRTRVFEDYHCLDALGGTRTLVTYTCGVLPDDTQRAALAAFLARGGRWLALHGTNSQLVLADGEPIACPPIHPELRAMLGSQFMAHPPIGRYKVRNAAPTHPLVAGIGTFFVEDEHYLQDVDPDVEVLLSSRFSGKTEMFERAEWTDGDQPILYLKHHGPGAVLYLTLGHARGRYDMRPISDRYPFVERGAWTLPVFQELLRRGLRWALGEG
jgi:hypothetical protein